LRKGGDDVSFQQDYLLRMIQDLSAFMTQIVRLRREQKNDEVLLLLADETTKLAGIPPSLVYALSDDDLIDTLQARGAIESERCYALGELFREEGSVYAERGESGEALLRLSKAARLYAEALSRAEGKETAPSIEGLRATLSLIHAADLPVATVDLLIEELLDVGVFDLVDNVLFELLEDSPSDDVVQLAIEAYRIMLTASDDELARADLARSEIELSLSGLTESNGPIDSQ
jgi:hypothetical protein